MTVEVRKNIIPHSLVDAIIACPDPDRVYPRHLPHMIDMSCGNDIIITIIIITWLIWAENGRRWLMLRQQQISHIVTSS